MLSIWTAPEPQRDVEGGESIIPLHVPGGVTEPQKQSSTSQHCLMGERQHSLNPTDHNVQPYSQLGAISTAGGCDWQSLFNAARKWPGAAPGSAGYPGTAGHSATCSCQAVH